MSQILDLAVADAALNYLATVPPKLRGQIVRRVRALTENPHPSTSKPLKNIKSEDGDAVFRERSGDYRILYVVKISDKSVIVLDIQHRKSVYRRPALTLPSGR